MSMTINGRVLEADVVLRAVQIFLECRVECEDDYMLMGNVTHVLRTAHKWEAKKAGVEYNNFKQIEKEYKEYNETGELPDCVYYYFAEIVDTVPPQAS